MKNIFAFVDYTDHASALKAIEEMNGKQFVNGEYLTVQQSRMYYFLTDFYSEWLSLVILTFVFLYSYHLDDS
jgi:RNA recognition motif-containing protein